MIMDNDPFRRGQPSNHTIFGVDMAILAGDALFPLGFRHIVSHTSSDLVPETQLLRVVAEIARAVGSTGMAAGQFVDLEGGPNAVEFVQEKKYGEMGECSAVCGGLLAGATDDEIPRLRRYGRAVGVLYQVVNDVLEAKLKSEDKDEKRRKRVRVMWRSMGWRRLWRWLRISKHRLRGSWIVLRSMVREQNPSTAL
ncbi:unnamed protein product [Ilex paraguariensis]|uniref:Geranylgeranyl pyrophosphate synthase n=1 Tax=Ilex paraguariensis TaxID=185542 RepID=A0ABC8UID0_9AQUA